MLIAVAVVYWLLFRTKIGFEFRASGENPDAARYAGMRSGLIIVAAMATAGALAGLAGANQVLGVLDRATPGFRQGSGLTPSPSRCWAGRTRSACCWPGCCSARLRPAGGRCRSTPASAST